MAMDARQMEEQAGIGRIYAAIGGVFDIFIGMHKLACAKSKFVIKSGT